MCSLDFDRPDISSREWRKARKTHACCECANPIKAGDHYERVAMLCDGSWATYVTCSNCHRIRHWLLDETEAKRLPESEFHDDCQAYFFGDLEKAIASVVCELSKEPRCSTHYWQILATTDGHRPGHDDCPVCDAEFEARQVARAALRQTESSP